MPDDVGRLLHAAILARKSVVIAGDQGAGKTTLLRALIASIPAPRAVRHARDRL